MKVPKKYLAFFLLSMFMLPHISFAYAADNSDYVGIEENDVYIWDVQIDEGPYEKYLEDYYEWRDYPEEVYEVYIEEDLDYMFDDDWDEDVEAWKLVIIEMLGEHKTDFRGDDIKYTKFSYSRYHTEDLEAEDWDRDVKYQRTRLYKFYKEMYEEAYISAKYGFRALIVAKNMDWKYLAKEADKRMEEDYEDAAGARRTKEGIESIYEYEVNGIYTFWDYGEYQDTNEIGEWETTSKYNDNGILKYYEWLYDGEPIMIVELQENIFIDYWWITGIIVAAAIVAIVVVVIKKR